MNWYDRLTKKHCAALCVTIMICVAIALLMMGRVPWCKCGYVKLWHGEVYSAENSQHLTDWYTFTHILHGFLYYALLWLVARHLPIRVRLVIAVAMAGAWELLENSNYIIERYRTQTISLDYFGDSVINSMTDILSCALGFTLASRLRLRWSLAIVLATELMLAYCIRDNLTLNIIMLIHPVQAIKRWQLAAGNVPIEILRANGLAPPEK